MLCSGQKWARTDNTQGRMKTRQQKEAATYTWTNLYIPAAEQEGKTKPAVHLGHYL
jgi:hypothetical protein